MSQPSPSRGRVTGTRLSSNTIIDSSTGVSIATFSFLPISSSFRRWRCASHVHTEDWLSTATSETPVATHHPTVWWNQRTSGVGTHPTSRLPSQPIRWQSSAAKLVFAGQTCPSITHRSTCVHWSDQPCAATRQDRTGLARAHMLLTDGGWSKWSLAGGVVGLGGCRTERGHPGARLSSGCPFGRGTSRRVPVEEVWTRPRMVPNGATAFGKQSTVHGGLAMIWPGSFRLPFVCLAIP